MGYTCHGCGYPELRPTAPRDPDDGAREYQCDYCGWEPDA